MIAVELNKNRQALAWRLHLLTKVAESRNLTDLLLEPILDPPDLKKARVEITTDETALRWNWGSWNRVEISIANANPSTFSRSYVKSQPSEINWQQRPAGSEIELTFHGANGLAGRAKVQVPDEANFGRDVNLSSPIKLIVTVQIAKEGLCSSIVVYLLQLDQQNQFRPKGAPIAFAAGQSNATFNLPSDFAGIVAVVATQNNTRKLIGAADYKDNDKLVPHRSDSDHLRVLRRFLQANGLIGREETKNASIEDWLKSWPSDSQRRLRYLHNSAREHFAPADADDLLRNHPTGLFRYLVLLGWGFKSPDAQTLVRQLNNIDFKAALRLAAPALGATLEVLSSPAERIWAIQHAAHKYLLEAATEAANHGTGALARALHLVEKRHEAIAAWQSRRKVSSL
jgi:hypothetical protein